MILAEAPCPISTTGGCSCRGLIGPRRSMHSVTVDVGVVIIARGGSIGSALMMRVPRNARCWCYDERKGDSKPEHAKFHFDCSARIQGIGANNLGQVNTPPECFRFIAPSKFQLSLRRHIPS